MARRPLPSAAAQDVVRNALNACKRTLWSAGFFSFFINMLMLTGPLFMLQVYDSVLVSKSIPTLVALFVLVTVLFVFLGLLELVRSRILARVGMLFEEQLQAPAFNAVVDHSLQRTPNVAGQPIRDVETVRGFISSGGPSAFFDMPWVPVYIAVIFLFHWTLGVLAIAAAVLLFTLAWISEVMTRDPIAKAAGATLESSTLAEEGRRNAEVLKSMGMLTAFRNRWKLSHDTARAEQVRLNDRAGAVTSSSKALRMLLQSAMLAAGAALAVQNLISPGVMIAGSIILSRALAPVEQSLGHWRGFQGARNAYQRLRQYLSTAPQRAEQMPLPSPSGHVAVENLIVHLGGEAPALLGINFQLLPGSGLGIIGATGSGKTTLARTMVGGIEPAKGAVRIDGASLDQWPEDQLSSVIGYLPQNVELFSGTIRDNISRFSENPDTNDIVTAAKLADVHEMILRMPLGYDTNVGEAGGTISAGQRQRIALARAVYKLPKVVVLDEPNSNLDGDGELALIRAVTALRQNGTTVVVIAHRPSGVKAVDNLLFLENGQQKMFGPKEQVFQSLRDEQARKLEEARQRDRPEQIGGEMENCEPETGAEPKVQTPEGDGVSPPSDHVSGQSDAAGPTRQPAGKSKPVIGDGVQRKVRPSFLSRRRRPPKVG